MHVASSSSYLYAFCAGLHLTDSCPGVQQSINVPLTVPPKACQAASGSAKAQPERCVIHEHGRSKRRAATGPDEMHNFHTVRSMHAMASGHTADKTPIASSRAEQPSQQAAPKVCFPGMPPVSLPRASKPSDKAEQASQPASRPPSGGGARRKTQARRPPKPSAGTEAMLLDAWGGRRHS